MYINIQKLAAELAAQGNPATISNPDNTVANAYINNISALTTAQVAQAQSILAAHDGTLPLGLIDATTVGAKLIAVVGATGSAFLPRDYTVFIRAAVAVTTPPTISIGTNSPNYNNVQAAVSLAGWNTADIQNFFMAAKMAALLSPTPVYINVTVAAVATQYVIGALFNGQLVNLT